MIKDFSRLPNVRYRRTLFNLPFRHKTTFNLGDLVPIYWQEVSPGDTFSVDSNFVLRLNSQLVKPIMDNLFLDTYYFFVPNRLAVKNWSEIMGENKDSCWKQTIEQTVPFVRVPNGEKAVKGSIANFIGVPLGEDLKGKKISKIPFNAYALIYNEWFRDENLQDPVLITDKTSDENGGTINANAFAPNNYLGLVAKANKIHDYFTSCLPQPQKGDAVTLSFGDTAPVVGDGQPLGLTGLNDPHLNNTYSVYNLTPNSAINAAGSGGLPADFDYHTAMYTLGMTPVANVATENDVNSTVYYRNSDYPQEMPTYNLNGSAKSYALGVSPRPDFSGLKTDLSQATAISVNDFRYAFQLQKMLEKDARGGTRYVEFLATHFGVTSPDARMQRPEYLGGNRTPINVSQVVQTSESTDTSKQGNVSAFSLTNGSAKWSKGFTEHGIVMCLVVVRQLHTYQQGLHKKLSRFKRTDFYDPIFNNIGEQPVYTKELYGAVDDDTEIFGYNEAWAEYRSGESRVSGELSSTYAQTLDNWHLGDDYETSPYLTGSFIEETPIYLDRCLAVPSTTSDQFLIDFYLTNKAIRVMQPYSIPGFVDHN